MNFGNTTLSGIKPINTPTNTADAGWGTVTGLPTPVLKSATDGRTYEGINFQGAGNVSVVHNSGATGSESFFPDAQTNTFSSTSADSTASILSVDSTSFAKSWGGGGPQLGNVHIPEGLL